MNNDNMQTLQAEVVSVANRQARVLVGGEEGTCLLTGNAVAGHGALVPGDLAEVEVTGEAQYGLVHVLPRSSSLYRGDRRKPGGEILVAANVDCLLAVVTANYLLHQTGFPEMAAMAASRAGLKSVLFISRWDITGESARGKVLEKLDIYRGFMDKVFAGASPRPQEELVQFLMGKSAVITGDRGSGKSTLIQGIMNELNHQLNKDDKSGIPAGTSSARLWHGPAGTRLIDTPGFREFALSGITKAEMERCFPEIAKQSQECLFSNCSHIYEDGCRILEALRNKRIRRERYDVYQKLAGHLKGGGNGGAAGRKSASATAAQKIDYRKTACSESFVCQVCGTLVTPGGAGSRHRNHCPSCLASVHLDEEPGDRASLCRGIMDPVSVWVRRGGEWAVIHRCRLCGVLSSNRIAADDNPALLLSIAVKPLAMTPFPLEKLDELVNRRPES